MEEESGTASLVTWAQISAHFGLGQAPCASVFLPESYSVLSSWCCVKIEQLIP